MQFHSIAVPFLLSIAHLRIPLTLCCTLDITLKRLLRRISNPSILLDMPIHLYSVLLSGPRILLHQVLLRLVVLLVQVLLRRPSHSCEPFLQAVLLNVLPQDIVIEQVVFDDRFPEILSAESNAEFAVRTSSAEKFDNGAGIDNAGRRLLICI